MKWDEMHPRSQDGYVAVHVLGYTYRERFRNDTQGYFDRDGESVISEELPAYTTDMGAAGVVLNWMQQNPSSIKLRWGEDTGLWECCWILNGKHYTGFSETPSLAICIAAVRAVGKDR